MIIRREVTYEWLASNLRGGPRDSALQVLTEDARHAMAVRGHRLVSVQAVQEGHGIRPVATFIVEGDPLPPSPGWDSEGRECWEYPP